MKSTFKILVLIFIALQSWGMDYVQKSFENDDKFCRSARFLFGEENSSHIFSIPLAQEERGTITLLSRVTLGIAEENVEDLADIECEQYKQAYKIMCSPYTSKEVSVKIRQREKQIADMKRKGDSKDKIEKFIEWLKEQGEWGPIIDEESQHQAQDFIEKTKMRTKTFLLKHTILTSKKHSTGQGVVVIYPGTNPKILEDDFYFNLTVPQWCIVDFNYTVHLLSKRLHGEKVTVEGLWLKKGFGYAISCYLLEFSLEHFDVSELEFFTVSCRHSVSVKIFEEKCKFYQSNSYEDATHVHHLPRSNICNSRADRTLSVWNKFLRKGYSGSYKVWYNDNIRMVLSDEFHKIGYKYFNC